jgi:hypothetical protein
MNLAAARTVLFAAGFALWALTSLLPFTEGIREGWDQPVYWQAGLPLVTAVQVLVTLVSSESVMRAPLWTILGHVVAMVLIHSPGTSLGLLPLAVVFMGLPIYGVLLFGAFIGRMVRRLTGLAS